MKPLAHQKLIVNADDFGLNAENDDAILQLHQLGAISSATLVVNGANAENAAHRAKTVGLPLGLHLNLGEGAPLSGPGPLTDASGKMLGKAGLREALDAGRIAQEILDREVVAQLDRFQVIAGLPPSHLDGHHHCHVAPGVALAVVRALPRYLAQPAIRLPLLDSALESETALQARFADEPDNLAFYRRIQHEANVAAPLFAQHSFRVPQTFFGISLMGRTMTPEALVALLDRLPLTENGIIELMCHPGLPSTEGEDFSRSPDRRQEFDTLNTVFSTGLTTTTNGSAGLEQPTARPGLRLTNFTALSS